MTKDLIEFAAATSDLAGTVLAETYAVTITRSLKGYRFNP